MKVLRRCVQIVKFGGAINVLVKRKGFNLSIDAFRDSYEGMLMPTSL